MRMEHKKFMTGKFLVQRFKIAVDHRYYYDDSTYFLSSELYERV